MSIEKVINQSGEWLNACNELLGEQSFTGTTKSRIAAALLHLAIEHHGSIHLLVGNHQYGSAFALLRPQFETYVRGVWFLRCASEEQIEEFIKVDKLPKIRSLLEDIQKVPGYEEGTLKAVKERVWNELCGYTHGGYVHVAYRNTENEIASNYEEQHIVGLLSTACAITLMASIAFAWLVQSEDMAIELASTHKKIFSENA